MKSLIALVAAIGIALSASWAAPPQLETYHGSALEKAIQDYMGTDYEVDGNRDGFAITWRPKDWSDGADPILRAGKAITRLAKWMNAQDTWFDGSILFGVERPGPGKPMDRLALLFLVETVDLKKANSDSMEVFNVMEIPMMPRESVAAFREFCRTWGRETLTFCARAGKRM